MLTNQGTMLIAEANAINGSFTQSGTVRLEGSVANENVTLVVANGFTNSGTIQLTSTTAGSGYTANLTVTSGTLTNAASGTTETVVGAGTGTLYLRAQLNNQGTVTVNKPLTMDQASVAHTNSGTINVNESLALSQSGTSPSFTNTGTINVASGKTMTVSGGTFTNATGGILQGTGTIHVAGTTFTNSGNINPGTSPGILTFTGNVPQTSTGAMNIEIGGLTAGTQHDRISISAVATLSGILNVTLISGFEPSVGDTFTVITYASRTGTFTTTNYPTLSGSKQWKITYNATSIVLSIEIPVPEINVKQGTTNIADGTGSYNFGNVNLGSNSVVTFTIENLGPGPLNLTGTPIVQISGTNQGDFVVTTQPTTPLAAGGSTTFVITFTPGGVGTRSATVSIANDDSDENPYDFTITGTGTGQPEINVKQDGINIPDGTGSYDFGTVNLGSNKLITFTIENLGNAPLNLTGTPYVQVSGAQGSDFEVTTQPTSPITDGTSNTFVITFTPHAAGLSTATVIIANDDSDENPYDFTITGTGGGAPVADAGPDQNVATGVEVSLDGSESYDSDGQMLTYLWSLESKPPASALTDADIDGKTTPNPSFVPDVIGTYHFRLVVNDGYTDSEPDTVEIHAFPATGNIAPNARAGKDQHAKVNTLAVLDGSASYDPDDGPADLMTFGWSFKAVPPGSGLLGKLLIDGDQASASFVPDAAGEYVVELQVNDGAATDTDEVTIVAYSTNVPPNARAGQDRKVAPGVKVILDGAASFDADEGPGPLTYQWRFVFVPEGSALTNGSIAKANTAGPEFTPDVEGAYVVELTVSDGEDTDFDHVMVVATTEPWVEVTQREGTVGTEFTLKGHDYEFGSAKGKLYMGKRALKAVSWASESILIQVKKPNPPATYDIRILPKKPKGGTQQVIWEPRCFTVKVPEVGEVTYVSAEQRYRVTGKFFGTKKGKIYLGELACKVMTWTMNPATNESEATFLLPKGITPGTYMLNVVNKVGRGKMEVSVP